MKGWRALGGRVAIVTGASSGIGAAVAERFGREGMRIALAARRSDLLEEVAARVRAAGGETLVAPTDVRDADAVAGLAAMTERMWGRIDVLVANAGIGQGGPLWEIDPERVREVLEVNLLGAILCARAVLPAMLRARSGHIIGIASVAGEVAAPPGIYAASKAGLLAFCEGLRRGVRPEGVWVSAVVPGFIDTPLVRSALGRRWARPPALVAEAVVRLLRRPRRLVVVPRWYRVPIVLNRGLPGLVDRAFPRYDPDRRRRRR